MKTFQYTNPLSIEAGEALTAKRFVDFEGKHTVDKRCIGVTIDDCDNGGMASVVGSGIAVVEAGNGITAGDHVKSDADGKALTLTYPTDTAANLAAAIVKFCGIALDTASGAGVFIRVKLP